MAVDYNTNKKVIKKEVSYLGRDFSDIRQNLIEFAKTYFPNQYNDFNESSPGMMFVEMASYVGDVLNYYVDNQYKETLLNYAEEKKNDYNIAQAYGYKPKTATPAVTEITVSQTVPAKALGGGEYEPDLDYAGVVSRNSIVATDTGVEFTIPEEVDFRATSALDPRDDILFITSSAGVPEKYKLRKRVNCISGTTIDETFSFNSPKKFDKVTLGRDNVTEIVSIVDSNNNKWYEVPFLAQDTVFETIENTSLNDPTYTQYQADTPYMLRLIKSTRRFTTRVTDNDRLEVRFGAGVSQNADEVLIPNPDNVGSALGYGISRLDESFDPSNFLKTGTYGLAPSNTTLTVTYRYGGGIEHNVRANSITRPKNVTFTIDDGNLDSDNVTESEDSLEFTNVNPARGGSSGETINEVRENALAYFNAQNRAVTRQDYLTRVYSLPQKYGNIAKAFITKDTQLIESDDNQIEEVENPFSMNLYLLGYDSNKNLSTLNEAVKQNLKMYLSQYRLLTDAITMKNAYVINIGVRFSIITQRGFNKSEVLFNCIQVVKNHFNISNWQINQPIILSDIAYKISTVDGVASVVPPVENNPNNEIVLIEGKFDTESGYSGNVYDLSSALKNGVVYPSLDPSIFEVRYPNQDIIGRVVGDL